MNESRDGENTLLEADRPMPLFGISASGNLLSIVLLHVLPPGLSKADFTP
jgi:hypothetical protein